MVEERYPGERRGLSLFLEELLPALERRGDPNGLLRHAIRRALETGDLRHLRHGRQIFNHLPRAERQALSAAMLERRARPPASRRDDDPPAPPPGRPEPAEVVCFEAASRERDAHHLPLQVELRREPASAAAVRVTVEAGTLPSVAADTLRRIAAMIEADRRLLSTRFWRGDRPGAEAEQPEQRDAR